MTFVKTDRPRRIDPIIDYFGEPLHDGPSDPPAHERLVADSYQAKEGLGTLGSRV